MATNLKSASWMRSAQNSKRSFYSKRHVFCDWGWGDEMTLCGVPFSTKSTHTGWPEYQIYACEITEGSQGVDCERCKNVMKGETIQ